MGVTFEGQKATSSDEPSYDQEGHIGQSNSLVYTLDKLGRSLMFTGCLSPKAHHFKGRDQCEIPQFKAGEKEAIAQKRVRQIIIYGCSTFKRSSDMLGVKEYEFVTVLD